ncbi:transporter [Arcobacter suis]|jgi:molybdopterin-binding protein|uniref:Molybdenum-pterin binding domain-containing protein n=1 Tax=Arcobacter suis CECT 7833 TaxID=663365 RepID=A0AAD0SNA2_9BACT|nr:MULTISPECIES: TOBE domain-containing protein [Arcobacteraceae]AXX88540.1 molybdenum-pterin binding domain-containing protein [Arcobacter suis CECT 7833]MBP9615884.1 TOBE domain-containing protein [Aliarcobacter sp.]MCG3687012.1 TOBE domain-containing protein [Aliarcobacter butzleri]RWS47626.1 transporter [Arcobacter suis]
MSQLVATIKKINSVDNLNIVEFDFNGLTLKMMSLDLNDDVKIGKKVELSVKPSNISIAKNLIGEISLSNQIVATIQSLENGQLLTSVILKINDTLLESIITVDSSKRMNLQIGEVVTILIKASNLSIGEVLND